MRKTLSQLQSRYPELRFTPGPQYYWSPETQEIFYVADISKSDDNDTATWSLLHETGHALLGHKTYVADIELLRLEVEAWERAKSLATELDMEIDENHIQDCLDTYRDWLDKRSICPTCGTKSIQTDHGSTYQCYNCHTAWRVSNNRFGRAYRQTKDVPATAIFI